MLYIYIVKALQPGAHTIQQTVVTESQPSPGKAAAVRGKCLAQLSVIKKLFDEKILIEEELLEQKSYILRTMRKLI